MKKLPLYFLALGLLLFIACKDQGNTSKKDTPTPAQQEAVKETVYSCPMDCEDGKTYAQKGQCPVCKMDLSLQANTEHGAAKKDKMCQCKEGECSCTKGECKCGTPGHDHFGNKV